MAKKSKIARNEQRKVIVARYDEKRRELKKTLVNENATPEEREAARVALQKLPRNASPVRVRNRPDRRSSARYLPEVWYLPRTLPRDGTPWRIARYY